MNIYTLIYEYIYTWLIKGLLLFQVIVITCTCMYIYGMSIEYEIVCYYFVSKNFFCILSYLLQKCFYCSVK